MLFQLTNSRGEIIETTQADIELSSEEIQEISQYLKSISAKFNRMKAQFDIMFSNNRKVFSCSDICEFMNDANIAYKSSLLMCSRLSLLESKIVDYQLLVEENSIKEANFKSLL